MRHWAITLACVLPFTGSGCGFSKNIRHNLATSPLYAYTDVASHHRHMQMGREAYLQMASHYGDHEFSSDYRRGFVDGFADYIDYGGVGEPPPIPPPSYRLYGYMTPAGLAAMEDWTVGFRHGAATAKASGLRDLVVVPVYWGPSYSSTIVNERTPKTKPAEELPPPKKADPPPAEPVTSPKKIDGPIEFKKLDPTKPGTARPAARPPISAKPKQAAPPDGVKPASYRKPVFKQEENPGDKPSVPPPPADDPPAERD